MLTVIDQMTSPPNPGWRWRDESGFEVANTNKHVWLKNVHARLVATGGFVGEGWAQAAEDWFCRNCPDVRCQDLSLPEPRERTFSDFLQFGHVVARHMDQEGALVAPEEAERRASICLGCPMNRSIAGMCNSCKAAQIASWLYRIIRARSTSQDHSLQSCGVCGCALTLSVWMPLEAQKDDRFPAETYPGHCWKRPPTICRAP